MQWRQRLRWPSQFSNMASMHYNREVPIWGSGRRHFAEKQHFHFLILVNIWENHVAMHPSVKPCWFSRLSSLFCKFCFDLFKYSRYLNSISCGSDSSDQDLQLWKLPGWVVYNFLTTIHIFHHLANIHNFTICIRFTFYHLANIHIFTTWTVESIFFTTWKVSTFCHLESIQQVSHWKTSWFSDFSLLSQSLLISSNMKIKNLIPSCPHLGAMGLLVVLLSNLWQGAEGEGAWFCSSSQHKYWRVRTTFHVKPIGWICH